jgi:hypothetical protein
MQGKVREMVADARHRALPLPARLAIPLMEFLEGYAADQSSSSVTSLKHAEGLPSSVTQPQPMVISEQKDEALSLAFSVFRRAWNDRKVLEETAFNAGKLSCFFLPGLFDWPVLVYLALLPMIMICDTQSCSSVALACTLDMAVTTRYCLLAGTTFS